MRMTKNLSLFTVYDHPKDFPDHFVCRRFDIVDGDVKPTGDFIKRKTLAGIRKVMNNMNNLTPIPRSEEDDPNIIETWI